MKKILLFSSVFLWSLLSYSQSDKEIRGNRIKSVTTFQDDKEAGIGTLLKDTYELFDKNGNTLQKINYKKDGSVGSKQTYKYDKNQKLTEELEYKGNDEIVLHKIYVYNKFQKKTEEREYSPSGELISQTIILYTPFGEKASETTTDSKGNVLKVTEYKYNNRNLKTQRSVLNKAKQEESLKKWAYEYY